MSTHTATINVLRTLCLLGQKGGRLGISDVMDDLGVSRATAYRYLSYLEAFGLASRFGRGDFILGPEIQSLERAARTGDPLISAATPVLGHLSRTTGATAILERLAGKRRTALLAQTGRVGPVRFAELLGSMESVQGNEESARTIDHATALKIWIQGDAANDLPEELATVIANAPASEAAELLCMVDGERIEASAFAAPVLLRGRVLCRLVALVQPGLVGLPDPTSMKEQVRRAARRIEGRLEAAT